MNLVHAVVSHKVRIIKIFTKIPNRWFSEKVFSGHFVTCRMTRVGCTYFLFKDNKTKQKVESAVAISLNIFHCQSGLTTSFYNINYGPPHTFV